MTTTEPTNGHRVTDATAFPIQRPTEAATSEFEEVQQLARQQREAHEKSEIQADPVFGTVLSRPEMDADRTVNEEVRAAERERRRQQGLAAVERDRKRDDANGRIADEAEKERVATAKAERKRRQLTDGGANLASAYRRYRGVSTGLAVLTVAGIAWTSYGVAHALGGANPDWIYYLVEPLFSLPLLAIVFMQITATENGRFHQVAPVQRVQNSHGQWVRKLSTLGRVEAGLLVGTLLINTWPAISDFTSAEHLFSRLGGPILIVVTVILQLVAAELFGEIIREAMLDGDNDEANVRERAKRAANKAVLILTAMREQSIKLEADGYPSVKEIGRRAHCEKGVAQSARDILPTFVEGVK